MKFGKTLGARICPEWSESYIRYHVLKRRLKRFQIEAENDRSNICSDPTHKHDSTNLGHIDSLDAAAAESEWGNCASLVVPALENALLDKPTWCAADASIFDNFCRMLLDFDALIEADLQKVNDLVNSEVEYCSKHVTALVDVMTAARFAGRGTEDSWLLDNLPRASTLLELSELQALHIRLCRLRAFIFMNSEGFRKITKKCDKLAIRFLATDQAEAHDSRMPRVMGRVKSSHAFAGATVKANALELIRQIESACPENEVVAIQEKSNRFAYGDMGDDGRKLLLHFTGNLERMQVDDSACVERQRSGRGYYVPDGGCCTTARAPDMVTTNPKVASFLIACAVGVVVLALPPGLLFQPEHGKAQRCLSLLITVTLLWATEALPLFATSLIIPTLVTVARVLPEDPSQPQVHTAYYR